MPRRSRTLRNGKGHIDMPYRGETHRKRSAEGKKLDELYRQHKIGWAYYHKICNKPKYWTWSS